MTGASNAVTDIRQETHAQRMRLKLALADTIVIDGQLSDLEHFLSVANRRGFPCEAFSDSRYRLVKEASLHDETSFD